MNTTELQNFLNSPTGKRLLAMAKAEQKEFETTLMLKKDFIEVKKNMLNSIQFGNPANKDKTFIRNIEGVLSRVKTDKAGNVQKVEKVTNDMELTGNELMEIKSLSPADYLRIKDNNFTPQTNDTEYYNSRVQIEGQPFDYAEMFLSRPSNDINSTRFASDWHKAYGSVENYQKGTTLEMLAFKEARTTENIRQLHNEVRELENEVELMELGQTPVEQTPVTSNMEGGAL
ncbi:hypothetical protein CON64_17365 [Bacillus pseudomycoides]|nr:hypothetical protein CON64_17365 [Bacillus pseudomycoides]